MRRAAKIHWWIPLGFLLIVGLAIWFWGEARNDSQTVATAIEAVEAAENAKYDRALALWDELLLAKPGDADLLLNQAVTVLKWIDETNNQLSSGLISDPAEQARLREELTAAFAKAEDTIAQVAKLPESDERTAFLQATFFETKAQHTQPPDDQPLREKAVQALVDALGKNPAQPLLACKLDDLTQSNGGEDPALLKQCTDSLFASWKHDPRNLYVLGRAGDALLKNEDARLKDLLLPSLELAKPMLSMMRSSLARMKPEELLSKASAAIDAGDWRQVQSVRQWFNILKGTSGFRADAKLVKPDIMALLDTRFLNRFADARSNSPLTGASGAVDYKSRVLLENASAVCWYDFDLDLTFDVAIAREKQLQLYATNKAGGIAAALQQELVLPFTPAGMIAVDLYEVESPTRPRTPTTVAEQVQSTPDTPTKPSQLSQEQIAKAKRHDTYQELLMWGTEGLAIIGITEPIEGESRKLAVLENDLGLGGIEHVQQVEPSDVDGDGDLDLIVACESKIAILQNNGNRTFMDISEFSTLPNADFHTVRMFACDIDRDLDQDVLLVNGESNVYMLENILHSQFRVRKLEGQTWDTGQPNVDVVANDLDGNGSWDISTVGESGNTNYFTRLPALGQWVASTSANSKSSGTRLAIVDLNNDSLLDLMTASSRGLTAAWGVGRGQWQSSEQVLIAGPVSAMTAVDANADGTLDLLCITDGKAVLLTPNQVAQGDYVQARVRGINDPNGGGRNNHYATGSTLELWSSGQMQARVVRDPVTHFGIGKLKPEDLRVIFNNGLTQHVRTVDANLLIEEIQELKGSCPFVYGWDGERYQLITDLLWNAPLGLQVARGEVLPDRRWENLLLPGELVKPKDGGYELRITEELWEVAYFDHIALTAIDHPADIDVFTNEKVGPSSIATPSVFTAQQKMFARAATDSHGRDCREKLAKVDRDFVQAFDELVCQGLAEPHFVELDFGTLEQAKPWRLFLNGWMHPTDTSLNIGISQNPNRRAPEPPSLWVVDGEGKWVCAQPFMGFPGGKPKSIVIDLAGVFRSDDHRLRIASSQQIFWDQAFVSHDSESLQVKQTELQLTAANLHYRGFGQLLPRAADQPHSYDYQSVDSSAKWPELAGPFTRFGDVRELLQADDDRMVVMVSGDEFTVHFKMPDQPIPDQPFPEGWRRDFILHNVGWDKDADLNTLAGDGSLPLPFKAMQSYPPSIEQADEAEEVLRRNADHLTRVRQRRDRR